MKKNQSYPISDFSKGDCGKFEDLVFIVTERLPGDRISASCLLTYENGETSDISFDFEDPEATYLGKGKLKISIEIDQEAG